MERQESKMKDLFSKLYNIPALQEGGKEFVRVAILAAVPLLIVQLEAGKVEYRLIVITAVVAGLRAVDRYIHQNDNVPLSGLSPV